MFETRFRKNGHVSQNIFGQTDTEKYSRTDVRTDFVRLPKLTVKPKIKKKKKVERSTYKLLPEISQMSLNLLQPCMF